MDQIKLKVVSDGTFLGTSIVDQDGKQLNNIIHMDWKLGLDGNPQLVLTLVVVPVEINYNASMTTLEELQNSA